MSKHIKKVLAYVIRKAELRMEVLVFEHVMHPDAGVQVPAGTVKENESLENAVLRELREEVGLVSVEIKSFLGEFEYYRQDRDEVHQRNVFHLTSKEKLPEAWLHSVESDDEDNLLQFKCYWLPMEKAKTVLAVDQGNYLNLLVE